MVTLSLRARDAIGLFPQEVFESVRLSGGHYISFQQISSGFRDGPTQRGIEDGWIEEVKQVPEITGWRVMKFWRYFEGPTQGDYSRAWDYIDHLRSVNNNSVGSRKRWMICILPCVFANTTSNIFPEYYSVLGKHKQTNVGWTADIWNADTMDLLIDLYIAIEDRYGDPNSPNYDPYYEALGTSESAIDFDTTPGDYSSTKLRTELERLAVEFRNNSSRGQVIFGTNYLGSNSTMYSLLRTLRTNKLTSGGPDTWGPQWIANGHRALQGDLCRRGELWSGGGSVTLEDMRDTLANQNQVQGPEIGGYMTDEDSNRGPFTCEELFDTANNVNRSQYMVWERNTTYGGDEQKWSTGQLPFIIANPLTHTASPYGPIPPPDPPPEPADLAYISIGSPGIADNAAVSVVWGTTPQENDLLMIIASLTTASTGRTLSAPGFVVGDSFGASSQQPIYAFLRAANADEGNASVVPNGSVAGNVLQAVGIILRNSLSTANAFGPVHHKTTSAANNSTPIDVTAITVAEAGSMGFVAVTYQSASSSLGAYNPGGTGAWTQIFFSSTALGSDQTLAIYRKDDLPAGTIPAGTITVAGQPTAHLARVMAFTVRPNSG